ncbi:MAG TPA: 16S rRNA (cytosine(1402)-N(4))-methyltransferase RsmH [Dehalococcoidia bacterium]|nr:16S rRNA (cytosine(1402)-N(4))-methyltransferase RsmH [Dehalococcoidia bacterium]
MTAPRPARSHEPVMLNEAIEGLAVHPGGSYVDATVGLGGHAAAIIEAASPGGRLLGIDCDADALAEAGKRLAAHGDAVVLAQGNFRDIVELCDEHDFTPIDGILLDLGVSSLQLDAEGRGFSFQRDEPLDMRMDQTEGITAREIVNEYAQDELATLIYQFGEERRSRAIARAIVQRRPIQTTGELVSAVEQAVGRGRSRQIHPATLTFQALRIAVNQEMDSLTEVLPAAHSLLGDAGSRIVVIAFHSLEDRLVKQYFQRESTDCICPPRIPMCVCDHVATLRRVTKRVRKPSEAETARNPRSRSARMRVAESPADRLAA